MRSLVVDKIASVALASDIGREVRISPDIPCEEGVLVAAEVLNNKSRYNTLELTSGRMAQVKRGDIIVGSRYPPENSGASLITLRKDSSALAVRFQRAQRCPMFK